LEDDKAAAEGEIVRLTDLISSLEDTIATAKGVMKT